MIPKDLVLHDVFLEFSITLFDNKAQERVCTKQQWQVTGYILPVTQCSCCKFQLPPVCMCSEMSLSYAGELPPWRGLNRGILRGKTPIDHTFVHVDLHGSCSPSNSFTAPYFIWQFTESWIELHWSRNPHLKKSLCHSLREVQGCIEIGLMVNNLILTYLGDWKLFKGIPIRWCYGFSVPGIGQRHVKIIFSFFLFLLRGSIYKTFYVCWMFLLINIQNIWSGFLNEYNYFCVACHD